MQFVQPAFWSTPRGYVAPRWTPVLVTPAITIVSSSVANPTVLTTLTPHGLATGDTVTVADHTGSTPAVDGALVATVLTPTTLSVPVNVSVAGSGGTVTRTTAAPVMTVAQAKLHARIDSSHTVEDVPVANWVRAATLQVEEDTGIKLLPQTYDLVGESFPTYGGPIVLPFGPLLAVTHIKTTDTAGVLQTMTAADYVADVTSRTGRIGLADAAVWPTDMRVFQPIALRVIVGHASIALVPETLLQAVRLAVSWHSMNREPTAMERESYEWIVGPHRPVCVA
jgi:uncharacterized phiE125 gp8 family phage protein